MESTGSRACGLRLLCSVWSLPGPEVELVSPALACLTTGRPGKSATKVLMIASFSVRLAWIVLKHFQNHDCIWSSQQQCCTDSSGSVFPIAEMKAERLGSLPEGSHWWGRPEPWAPSLVRGVFTHPEAATPGPPHLIQCKMSAMVGMSNSYVET